MLYDTQMTCVIKVGKLIYMYCKTEVSWLRDQSLKLNDMIQSYNIEYFGVLLHGVNQELYTF